MSELAQESPGGQVCANIGPLERRRRNVVGVIGTVITIILVAALLEARIWWPYRLLVAPTTFLGAIGFLQAQAQTCVAFARSGMKVLGDDRAKAVRVTSAEAQAISRQARVVYRNAVLATAVVTGLVLLLPGR